MVQWSKLPPDVAQKNEIVFRPPVRARQKTGSAAESPGSWTKGTASQYVRKTPAKEGGAATYHISWVCT